MNPTWRTLTNDVDGNYIIFIRGVSLEVLLAIREGYEMEFVY